MSISRPHEEQADAILIETRAVGLMRRQVREQVSEHLADKGNTKVTHPANNSLASLPGSLAVNLFQSDPPRDDKSPDWLLYSGKCQCIPVAALISPRKQLVFTKG